MAGSSEDLSSRILEHLSSDRYRPQRARKLARTLGVEEPEYPAFRAAVKELMRSGRVMLGGGNCVMLPDASDATDRIVGQFRGHQRGFGFVVPDSTVEHGDLFIPPGSTLDAITGDTVVARITRRGKGGDNTRVEGEVIEIRERGQSQFVGELVREGNNWIVLPDGKALHVPILVGDAKSTRARSGDQVVVELTTFPADGRPGRGVIVEVLGRRGDPGIDTVSIIRQYHFREAFSDEVLDDARRSVREHDVAEALAQREDLRQEVVVTIDPDDAKDYDDAISITTTRNGQVELGVHIADVSTFVQPGRPLDTEAALRGNSIYLPRHVVPMLPEVLSNGLCSLQEAEPRLTKSAFITYDKGGKRTGARFANTVIQSTKRLTYGEATKILEGQTRDYAPQVVDLVQKMDRLARLIQKRRHAGGMIVLDLPEVEIVLNDEGEITGVEPADTSFSHTIIEMFMVEANEVVAELMTRLEVPHLRRIHPDPPPDAQQKLSRFLAVLGKRVPEKMERHELIQLLAGVRGQPDAFAVNLAVLRSMAQAEYSPRALGHFALASKHYSHFTSPIRRYPDLVIHRLLQEYLTSGLKSQRHRKSIPSVETLTEVGKRCSYTERRAEAAERELKTIKILRLLEKHLGDIEDGIVTGVANVGLFVQINRYLIDGLIRFEDLPDDWWEIDPRGGCVVGQRSGRRIRVGQPVRVQIASVDVGARELELMLHDDDQAARRGAAQPARTGPRGKRPPMPPPPGGRKRGDTRGPKHPAARKKKRPSHGRRR